jgi:hypothetical protein
MVSVAVPHPPEEALMSKAKLKRPKRSLVKRSREPLYIVVETKSGGDIPVSPRFKLQDDPEIWATMVFTDKQKAEEILAHTQRLNPGEPLAVGTISVQDMLYHIRMTAAIPMLQSQGTVVQYMGPPTAPVDAICVDGDVYPLILSAFPKVFQDDPPYATFSEAFEALLRRIKRSRSR